jgi:hypothetical protein
MISNADYARFSSAYESRIICIPFSGLAAIVTDESLGSPGPASLTAITRYSYSFKGVTFSSTKFVP